jgi:hypothetical protein
LDGIVLGFASNQTLYIEDCVDWVNCGLVLRSLAGQTLTLICIGDVAGGDSITLLVADDLNTPVFEDSDARIRRSKINTNHWAVNVRITGSIGYHKESKDYEDTSLH